MRPREESCSNASECVLSMREFLLCLVIRIPMADRFLPADDPVLEEVLNWTVARDAQDIRRLLEWLPMARSSKERRALLSRVHELLSEVELSLNGLDSMH